MRFRGAVILHTEALRHRHTARRPKLKCHLGDSFVVARAVSVTLVLGLVREHQIKIHHCATRRGRSTPASYVSAGHVRARSSGGSNP